jgi:hypothetical protein
MSRENYPLRPERPLGVSILTIWDGVALGVIPALRGGLNIATSSNQGEISMITMCLSLGLPIAILTAAIGAFKGNDRARLGLLFLLTIYFSLNIFQNVTLIIAGNLAPEEQVRSIGGIFIAIISVLINLWYFLRPNTIIYFRRPIQPQQQGKPF